MPSTSPSPAPHLLPVPFYAQQKYQCGPAALASMLGYAGIEIAPDALVDEVWLPERQGSLGMELVAAARARGLLVYPVNTEQHLVAELNAGHPVLIQQNLLFNWWPQWHFAVVIGEADQGALLYLHSGNHKAMKVDRQWFDNHWRKADRSGYVMLPDGQLPAQTEARQLTRAISETARVSGQPALTFWQAAAQRYPQQALVRFAEGNALYQSGRSKNAINAWLAAVNAQPDFSPAWNNLADALNRQQCGETAKAAIDQAVRLAPDNATYRQTQKEIQGPDRNDVCQHWHGQLPIREAVQSSE